LYGRIAAMQSTTAARFSAVLAHASSNISRATASGCDASVAAHVGDRGAAAAAIETQDATLAARIEVAAHVVDDLDRRLNQMDSAIEMAAKRGKTSTPLSAIESQKKARAALASARNEAAGILASLKTERAQTSACGRQIETEAAPIRYVAEMLGADTDSERAIRWLIALMVLCCDPLAIALTAAASARRSTAKATFGPKHLRRLPYRRDRGLQRLWASKTSRAPFRGPPPIAFWDASHLAVTSPTASSLSS
jgi:hypothetical protein